MKARKKKEKKKVPKEPAEMGRPTKYDPDVHPNMAWMLAVRGKTVKEIAAGIGISTSTYNAWINIYEDFSNAVKRGRDAADAEVERALFKRACGYDFEYTETTTDPEKGTTTKHTVKHIPGDVTAQIFYLCNRRKDDWRNVSRIECSGPDGKPISISTDPKQLTDEQIIAMIRKERDRK